MSISEIEAYILNTMPMNANKPKSNPKTRAPRVKRGTVRPGSSAWIAAERVSDALAERSRTKAALDASIAVLAASEGFTEAQMIIVSETVQKTAEAFRRAEETCILAMQTLLAA